MSAGSEVLTAAVLNICLDIISQEHIASIFRIEEYKPSKESP
jgi:hypothetical protein